MLENENTPAVSNIITSYNYAAYITRAIRSCLAQKFCDVEIIVVDDASTDDTISVIDTWMYNITLIRNETNMGVAASRNVGLKAARAPFVIMLDADDYITKYACFILKEYCESNNELLATACVYIKVDENENVIGRCSAKDEPISCGVMYRTDLLRALNGYNNNIRHREEEEMRRRIGERYVVDYLRMPLYRYCIHGKNKTLSEEYKHFDLAITTEALKILAKEYENK